jgi:RNA polymerase sigma-70 factor (ECF subfamily)
MYEYISEKVTATEPFEQEELARLLDKALQLVPPAARTSFVLQYMEGFDQKYVASQQNISLQVVKNNVSKALKILRDVLGTKKSL